MTGRWGGLEDQHKSLFDPDIMPGDVLDIISDTLLFFPDFFLGSKGFLTPGFLNGSLDDYSSDTLNS